MSKDTRIPVRVSSELKAAFEQAAARDETTVSGWLRWLGEQRLEELELVKEGMNIYGQSVLGESAIPLVCDKHAQMLIDREAPLDLVEALCTFVDGWWAHGPQVPAMFTLAHDRMNARIIEEHRLRAVAAGEKTSRPSAAAGSTGTRKARDKRKRRHGR